MAIPKPPPNQQLYEFLLVGSVSDSELPSLLHRLRGLADFATCGGIAFIDKEQTYKIEIGNTRSVVRVRQSLDNAEAPLQLIYTGQLDLGDANRPAGVRSCVHTACSNSAAECLKEIGFMAVYELILRGYVFRKGQMKIAVFKLYQPSGEGTGVAGAQLLSEHYLVELSAVTTSGHDNVGMEMRAFAEQLKPYPMEQL
ncbi:mediator of RNA polymerase II transcription subunit 18-like [Halichondria panicea]|uniref:mediator of RNA polymerase II transcription subunit 18-like n=1 Tax=Halichondria panicea TaxID=6063 RepID=UPI00312B6B82